MKSLKGPNRQMLKKIIPEIYIECKVDNFQLGEHLLEQVIHNKYIHFSYIYQLYTTSTFTSVTFTSYTQQAHSLQLHLPVIHNKHIHFSYIYQLCITRNEIAHVSEIHVTCIGLYFTTKLSFSDV